MSSAIIGKSGTTPIKFNVEALMRTRLLIQANSGGGKSYCIRKILETTYGKIQHIVLDPEGEFASLREKYDYLLVGKDGDIQTDIRSAELLAKKLLEENVNAIIDLYELKHHERILFVKRFLDAMINARKDLWHHCLVVVDEAHIFCPEKEKSEAGSSVIDLATRGRKRGFCACLATQRLSKLHKDAAAECNNKLIGRTGLDVDMKRARDLEPGEFYAFGPALSHEIKKVKIGKVETSHPELGAGKIIVPAPATAKIKVVLAKLMDLPQKAEEELFEKEDLQRKVRELNAELRKAHAEKNRASVPVDKNQLAQSKSQGFSEGARAMEEQYQSYSKKLLQKLNERDVAIKKMLDEISIKDFKLPAKPEFKKPLNSNQPVSEKHSISNYKIAAIPAPRTPARIPLNETESKNGVLTKGALKMLKAVAMFHPKPITRQQVATLSGFTASSGTFGNYWGSLKKNDLIYESNGRTEITESGLQSAGSVPSLPSNPEEIVDMWANRFGGGAARMLRIIAEIYPKEISREEIGEKAGIVHTSGTFGNYLGELRKNRLIQVNGQIVRASKTLFLEEE